MLFYVREWENENGEVHPLFVDIPSFSKDEREFCFITCYKKRFSKFSIYGGLFKEYTLLYPSFLSLLENVEDYLCSILYVHKGYVLFNIISLMCSMENIHKELCTHVYESYGLWWYMFFDKYPYLTEGYPKYY